MREEYNSVLSTPTESDTDISVKPKYRPIYQSISSDLLLIQPAITLMDFFFDSYFAIKL